MSSTPASASMSGSSVLPGLPNTWVTPSVRRTSSSTSRPLLPLDGPLLSLDELGIPTTVPAVATLDLYRP